MKVRFTLATGVLVLVLATAGAFVVHGQGTNAGDLDGEVVDGSPGSHLGIVGASVCFTYISGCVATNSTGGFLFQNVPAGQYAIEVTSSGFNPSPLISVGVSTGALSHAGQIGLQPISPPWYNGMLPVIILSIIAVVGIATTGVLAVKVAGYKRANERNPKPQCGPLVRSLFHQFLADHRKLELRAALEFGSALITAQTLSRVELDFES